MGRKIKHYSSGYQIRRKRQRKILGSVLFGVLLILLVGIGYIGAKTITEIRQKEPGLQHGLQIESESSIPDRSNDPIGQDDGSISDSSGTGDSSNSDSGQAELLYSGYGSPVSNYEPVKENPFTRYGAPLAAFIPVPNAPEPVDNEDVRAITMPLESALSTDAARTFLESVSPEMYNAVVVPLKDDNGIIYYPTAVSLAANCGAISSKQVDLTSIADLIKSYGLKPVASIYSLQDHTAAHTRYGTSYFWMNDGSTTWLDAKVVNGGRPWMNPYMQNTVDYLSAIAAEIDAAGFRDLLVYGNQYPNTTLQQKLGVGKDDGVSRTDQLQKVLQTMQDAAPGLRVIPAYQGACYTEGVNTQVYTATPNVFTFTPSAPIIDSDVTILDLVTADVTTLMPVIDSEETIPSLAERGITSYILK